METNKLDRFFKEKIGPLEIQPSERSWDALNHQLKEKRRKILFRRLAIAASIVLMGIAGISVYRLQGDVSGNTVVETRKQGSPRTEEIQLALKPAKIADETVEDVPDLQESDNINTIPEEIVEIPKEQEEPLISQVVVNEPDPEYVSEESTGEEAPEEQHIEEEADDFPVQLAEAEIPHESEDVKYLPVRIKYISGDQKSGKSNAKAILEKGFNKITDIAENTILADNYKSKYMNVREDIVSLNNKLFNKTGKETIN